MFVLGHVGIGRALVRRWRDRLPLVPLSIGTLLPDLIDKPLYYSRLWPYITATRTFGHTGLLLLALAGAGVLFESRVLKALAAGVATHLLLDTIGDLPDGLRNSSALIAATWPLSGGRFADFYLPSLTAHAWLLLLSWPTLGGELVGGLLLLREWRRRRALAVTRASDRQCEE
jgi:hypothetical protein